MGPFGVSLKVAVLLASCTCAASESQNDPVNLRTTDPKMINVVAHGPDWRPEFFAIDGLACDYLLSHFAPTHTSPPPLAHGAKGHALTNAEKKNPTKQAQSETITMNMTTALARLLPNKFPPFDRQVGHEVNLGSITLIGDKITLNGQAIGPEAQSLLANACRASGH